MTNQPIRRPDWSAQQYSSQYSSEPHWHTFCAFGGERQGWAVTCGCWGGGDGRTGQAVHLCEDVRILLSGALDVISGICEVVVRLFFTHWLQHVIPESCSHASLSSFTEVEAVQREVGGVRSAVNIQRSYGVPKKGLHDHSKVLSPIIAAFIHQLLDLKL